MFGGPLFPTAASTKLRLLLREDVIPGAMIYTDGRKIFMVLDQSGSRQLEGTQPLQKDLRKGVHSVVPLPDRTIGTLQRWRACLLINGGPDEALSL